MTPTEVRGLEQIGWAYDGLMWAADVAGLRRWRRQLVRGARGRTLEVGVGTGRNLSLYPAGVDLVALDPDRRLLERAGRQGGAVVMVAGAAEALPFCDEVFDTVVCSLVLCSVRDPARSLAEIRRVLRPSGEVRLLEHVRHGHPRWARLQDRVQPMWTCMTGGCHPNRDTEAAVERAGFRILPESRESRGVLRLFSAARTGSH